MTTPSTNGARTEPLTARQRRKLMIGPTGTAFSPQDRLFAAFDDGAVFDYGTFEAADIDEMLERSGRARAVEQVLTLPLRAATWTIEEAPGDTGEAELCRDVLSKKLPTILDQMTTGVGYRRAFFECTWRLDGGKIVYDRIDHRPATGCEAGFDPATGAPRGFRQRVVPMGMHWPTAKDGETPGYRTVAPERAFVYTHGGYRDPIHGQSDLAVPLWCWETIQKVSFLWFGYLEGQSQPKVIVYGDDPTSAQENAEDVASLKASGVLGLPRSGDPAAKVFEVIESSGQGAAGYEAAIAWLEGQMTSSVLASFTDLASAASSGRGSFALSADQSEFFLASRQAVADEMADAVRHGLFAPLVAHNFGTLDHLPSFTIGPLSRHATDRALSLLTAVVSAQQLNIPREFVDQLTAAVATHLGLDEDQVAEAIEIEVKRREEADKIKAEQQRQLLANPVMAAATGQSPLAKPKAPAAPRPPAPPKVPALAADNDAVELAAKEHTGGMVCLVPDAASAAKLAVPGGEPVDQLHVTLAYLGDDVTGWSAARRDMLIDAMRVHAGRGSITARAFAHTTFNADGGPDGQREPCAVYGIGDSDALAPLHSAVVSDIDDPWGAAPPQHEPWAPHVTAAYGRTAADLTYLGPVTFDRLAVVLGGQWTYLPLHAKES